MENVDYRPAYIEFNIADDQLMPMSLGKYENAEEAAKFIGGNAISINHALTVPRHMDNFEKSEMRKKYNNVLENILPTNEQKLLIATQQLAEAKRLEKEAQEMVNAAMTEVKMLAQEVKRGLVDMCLDELFTHRLAIRGKYYFYTYIDQELRLCAIRDIPESEKSEIFNQAAENEKFIDLVTNGTIEP